jgi:hypothetical protein
MSPRSQRRPSRTFQVRRWALGWLLDPSPAEEVNNNTAFVRRLACFTHIGHFTPELGELQVHAPGSRVLGGQGHAPAIACFFPAQSAGVGLAGQSGKVADRGHGTHDKAATQTSYRAARLRPVNR